MQIHNWELSILVKEGDDNQKRSVKAKCSYEYV